MSWETKEQQTVHKFLVLSQLLGLFVTSIGSLVLLGWWLNLPELKFTMPGLVTMKTNTALGFILSGSALLLWSQQPSKSWSLGYIRGSAILVAGLGILTLNEIFFDLDLGIDQLLLPEPVSMGNRFRPGQMAPTSAVNFALIGSALLLMTGTHRMNHKIAQSLIYLVLTFSLVTLMGYFYHAQILYQPSNLLIAMSLPTAVLFCLLSLGILSHFPQEGLVGMFTSDSLGGHLGRRLVPAIIVTFFLLDGLIELAIQHQLVGHDFDRIYLAVLVTVIVIILTGQVANSLDRIDTQRQEGEYKIAKFNRLYTTISQVNQAIVRATDRETLFQDICRIVVEESSFRMVAWIGMVEKTSQIVVPMAKYGVDDSYLETLKISLMEDSADGDPTREAVRQSQPIICANFDNSSSKGSWQTQAWQHGYQAAAAFPIYVCQDLAGVMTLYATESDFFDEVEINSLKQVIDNVSYALEQGKEAGMGQLVQEIAERKRAEEALRESEERYRFLVANLPNTAVLLFNRELRFLLVGGEEMSKNYFDPVLMAGKHFRDEFPPEIVERFEPLCQQALLGEATAFQMQYGDSYYSHHILPVRNAKGEVYLGMVVSRNITERKRHEEALCQAKEIAEQANIALSQFKTTLDMTLDAVFMLETENFKIIYANQGASRQIGYSPEELLQKTVLDILHDFTNDQFRNLVAPLLEGSKSVQVYETWHQRKNGDVIPVEVFLQHIQLPGNTHCFVKIARDITERKQSEANLQEAKDKAEAANRAKSAFLANMSHELRTPLNGILGFAQILKRDEKLSQDQKDKVAVIQKSGEYLLTMITDILDLSKIEADRLELQPAAFYFNSFLSGIVELFEMRAQQKGIAFYYERLSNLPKAVYADEKRLRQILINLLGNAVKFTEKGGVCLKVGYQDSDQIRFQIEDTGLGIATADLEKIFLPFQQTGDKSYQAQGTGLGLAITKKLVDMMGGEIHVESVLNQGSKFWVILKLSEALEVPPEELVEQSIIIGYQRSLIPPYRGEKVRILVVDDHWENRAVVTKLLVPLGFELAEAANGREAIETAYQWCPEVIIMDLVMPVMDGFTATRLLRKTPELKDVIIIALSASVFDFHQLESTQAGCDDFIAKPFRLETLLACLQKHLHLTWIYEQPKTVPLATPSATLSSPLVEMTTEEVLPSVEQLTRLSQLAKKGDIQGILDVLEELEKSDTRLVPITTHLRKLAKNFQRKKIFEWVHRHLEMNVTHQTDYPPDRTAFDTK